MKFPTVGITETPYYKILKILEKEEKKKPKNILIEKINRGTFYNKVPKYKYY